MFISPSYVLVAEPLDINATMSGGEITMAATSGWCKKEPIPYNFTLESHLDFNGSYALTFNYMYDGGGYKVRFNVTPDFIQHAYKEVAHKALLGCIFYPVVDKHELNALAANSFRHYVDRFLESLTKNMGSNGFIDHNTSISDASLDLPGVSEIVEHPCDCEKRGFYDSVWMIVQHLNDQHDWPRDKIADWIDELHDSGIINAEFQPWDDNVGLEET